MPKKHLSTAGVPLYRNAAHWTPVDKDDDDNGGDGYNGDNGDDGDDGDEGELEVVILVVLGLKEPLRRRWY